MGNQQNQGKAKTDKNLIHPKSVFSLALIKISSNSSAIPES
jgi:hypothetical protein